MIDRPTIEAEVSAFVARLAGRPVLPADALISSQLLESIAAVQLIEFVERVFDIVVEDHDLELKNVDSIDAVVALVDRKLKRRND